MKRIGLDVLKVLVCGIVFFVGMILGSPLAQALGLPAPELPAGAEVGPVLQLTALSGLMMAVLLAYLSRRLAGGLLTRWAVLGSLSYVAYGLNTALEAGVFMANRNTALFSAVTSLTSCGLCAGAAALLFRPHQAPVEGGGQAYWARARAFFGAWRSKEWAWRLAGALLAFPAAYVLFGNIIYPFVHQYYEQGLAGLTVTTGWGQLLPVLLLRSLLFLVAGVIFMIAWQGSRRSLFWSLGAALFILVGGLYMFQAYWYPAVMRIGHALEILADSFSNAAGLVFLLVPASRKSAAAISTLDVK